MRHDDTAAALAAAMPGGIGLRESERIAAFQAERLTEGGYVLVHPDLEQSAHVGATLARHTPPLQTRVLYQGSAVRDAVAEEVGGDE